MTGLKRRRAEAAGGARPGTAARRAWASTVWLVAGTAVVAITSYSLSLKVANERRETEKLARGNAALESDLKALNAELRVRMRLPQLQRWNDGVLGLVPIGATQFLDSPARLAAYGRPLASDVPLPRPQLAVRDLAPAAPAAVRPQLVSASMAPAVEAAPRAVARPAEAAPDDLLRQVEMTFGAAPAPNP